METKTNVDNIWKSLGKWGRYQILQVTILLVDIIPCALNQLNFVFSGYRPSFQCNEASDTSVLYENNGTSPSVEYSDCWVDVFTNESVIKHSCSTGFNYSVPKSRTIITEYDLVCEHEALGELTQTFLILGQGIGAAVFTPFADKYGRKIIHVGCHVALIAVGFGMAYAPNYTVFIIMKLLAGILVEGFGLTGAILTLELFPMEIRANPYIFGLLFWTTGCVLVTPFGYFFRDLSWRYMQIAITLVSVYCIAEIWVLDESLRWLIANGRNDKAEKIIRKAAKINKVDINDVLQTIEEMEKVEIPTEHETCSSDTHPVSKPETETVKTDTGNGISSEVKVAPAQSSPIHIFTNKHLFITSLISWYTWIVNSLTYYSLFLISSQLSGSRFLNYFLYAVIEYPAFLILIFVINRIGRKKTCIMFHSVVAVSLIIASILTVLEGNYIAETAITILSLIGKLGITGSFSLIFLYTPELYPTNLRNAGIGMSSTAARIGGMVAPFSMNLYRRAAWAPGAIFGTMCLLVTLFVTYLPETRVLELPQTIDELDKWYTDRRIRKKQQRKLKSAVTKH